MLTTEEKDELISIARAAVEARLSNRKPVKASRGGVLSRCQGVFATIRRKGELAGCIGYIQSDRPLGEVVPEVAVKAAFEDPRFAPLQPGDVDQISIELSLLSHLQRISTSAELQLGKHGLVIECGLHRGLLLPQVATEHGWDSETFIDSAFRKAGLSPASRDDPDSVMYVFTAEVVTSDEVATR